ncbi:type VI secretion system-associated protein TagF [Jannaschia sp. LMIT008]|uniref:type VI secretion system-associated protein TagF n=1 Tax=Jannaschia maritima TaxID=3032585 RepID=UPI002811F0A4|nr:type VI secretion system-associated protein TagF [Jannaschia sp. LMIT008]
MSASPGLTLTWPDGAGWFGKLPARGDFVHSGLSDAVRDAVSAWLDGTLAEMRDRVGGDWAARFDAMPRLRFWLGSHVAAGGPWAGVVAPSRDRVGRRYPIVAMAPGAAAPPTLDADRDRHDALDALIDTLLMDGPAPMAASVRADPPAAAVWAARGDGASDRLLFDVAAADYAAAAGARSYVWTEGAVWCDTGLPGVDGLGWLTGLVRDA